MRKKLYWGTSKYIESKSPCYKYEVHVAFLNDVRHFFQLFLHLFLLSELHDLWNLKRRGINPVMLFDLGFKVITLCWSLRAGGREIKSFHFMIIKSQFYFSSKEPYKIVQFYISWNETTLFCRIAEPVLKRLGPILQVLFQSYFLLSRVFWNCLSEDSISLW